MQEEALQGLAVSLIVEGYTYAEVGGFDRFRQSLGSAVRMQQDGIVREVLLIDTASHEAIVQKVPGYADAFRKGLQKHAAARDERIVSNLSASAEERYLAFLQTYPSIATRVPQRMLASYLGVSPETVSRIRRKLAGR